MRNYAIAAIIVLAIVMTWFVAWLLDPLAHRYKHDWYYGDGIKITGIDEGKGIRFYRVRSDVRRQEHGNIRLVWDGQSYLVENLTREFLEELGAVQTEEVFPDYLALLTDCEDEMAGFTLFKNGTVQTCVVVASTPFPSCQEIGLEVNGSSVFSLPISADELERVLGKPIRKEKEFAVN